MQYTLRNIPERLDALLRERARGEGRSLNDVVIEALLQSMGLSGQPVRRRNLESFVGCWVKDPQAERCLEDQRLVDAELWR